jgi:hypothetical protein
MDLWGSMPVASGAVVDWALTSFCETALHTTIRKIENQTERSRSLFMTLSFSRDMHAYGESYTSRLPGNQKLISVYW